MANWNHQNNQNKEMNLKMELVPYINERTEIRERESKAKSYSKSIHKRNRNRKQALSIILQAIVALPACYAVILCLYLLV